MMKFPHQFFSLLSTPFTFVINNNLLILVTLAPATLSPLMLYVLLSTPRPKGEIIGIIFFNSIHNASIFILLGIPTKPSSLDSGTTVLYSFFVFIDSA